MARTVPHPSGKGFHVIEQTNIGVDDDDLTSPHIVRELARRHPAMLIQCLILVPDILVRLLGQSGCIGWPQWWYIDRGTRIHFTPALFVKFDRPPVPRVS